MQTPRILHSTNQAGHALRARSHSGRLCMRADRACRAEMVFAPADWLKSERLIPLYENLPRAPGDNFYYAQGDALLEMASKHRFHWSVARPYTIIWYGPGAAMNMGTSLASYATLARETGIPFVFSGSPQSYNGLVDMTDARLLAAHLEWERLNPPNSRGVS